MRIDVRYNRYNNTLFRVGLIMFTRSTQLESIDNFYSVSRIISIATSNDSGSLLKVQVDISSENDDDSIDNSAICLMGLRTI